jgi:hypothetical protein
MQNDTDFIDLTLTYTRKGCPLSITFVREIDHVRTGDVFNIIWDIEKNPLGTPAHQMDDLSSLPFVLPFLTTMILLCDSLVQNSKCKDLRKILQTSWYM